MNDFFRSGSDIRRAGSAALDLAYVAAGRFDGFWEFKLLNLLVAVKVTLDEILSVYWKNFVCLLMKLIPDQRYNLNYYRV